MKNTIVILSILLLILSGCAEEQSTSAESDQCDFNKDGRVDQIETRRCQQLQTTSEGDITTCFDLGCFEPKFAACEKASVTYSVPELQVSYYYEIIGSKDGLCEMKSKFTANPNQAFIGKEMTCKYDNSKDFETAAAEVLTNPESYCSGPLYGLLTGETEIPSTGTKESLPECTETCEACVSGKQEYHYKGADYVCSDCFGDSDCIEGYECSNNVCVSVDVLEDNSLACPGYDSKLDCHEFGCDCDTYECDNCDTGTMSLNILADGCRCVECRKDYQCKDGYVCVGYQCV